MANEIESTVQALIGAVAKNPELLGRLLEHPYSTIGNVTNNNNVSKEEASQVVTAMSTLASGKQVDFGGLGTMASMLLGQNNNSVHSLATSLLGSGSPKGVDVSAGVTQKVIKSLAAGVDMSDGIDAKDLIGVVAAFLK